MTRPPTKRMSRIASATKASLMIGQLQAMQRQAANEEGGQASAIALPAAVTDEQVREAALVLPRAQAMRELAKRLNDQVEAALKEAIEAHLGHELADPAEIAGRLHYEEPVEDPEGKHGPGRVYVLDGVPLLWVGEPRLEEHDDEVNASRPVKRYVRAEVGSA